MDISTLSLNDLKALAYDNLAQIEAAKNNLNVINEEIARRAQTGEKTEQKPEKETKKK